MKDNMRVESYFASPVWLDYRPEWVDTLNKAGNIHIKNARAKNKDLIFVGGSTFVVAEVL